MQLKLSFKEIIKTYIIDHKLLNQRYKSKYSIDDIINVIEYVLITGSSWRSLNLPVFYNKFKWQSFYYHFNKLSKLNIF